MMARHAAAALVAAALVASPMATAAYTAVTPCRLLDTRLAGVAVAAHSAIAFDVAGPC